MTPARITARSNGSIVGNIALAWFMQAVAECVSERASCVEWLRGFRRVAAIHPDNGWIDRERNVIKWLPDALYMRSVGVGDLVALSGNYGWRLVLVTQVDPPGQFHIPGGAGDHNRYHFRQVGPAFQIPEAPQ
jgi:hypothetical protein